MIFFFLCILLHCLNFHNSYESLTKSTKLLFLKENKLVSRVKGWEVRGLVNLKGVPRGTEVKQRRQLPTLI